MRAGQALIFSRQVNHGSHNALNYVSESVLSMTADMPTEAWTHLGFRGVVEVKSSRALWWGSCKYLRPLLR